MLDGVKYISIIIFLETICSNAAKKCSNSLWFSKIINVKIVVLLALYLLL